MMNRYPLLARYFGKMAKSKKERSLLHQQNLFRNSQEGKMPQMVKEELRSLEEISQVRHKQISFHAKFNRLQEAFKSMDSSLEAFFYKRQFNLDNANFLLQILAEKGELQQAEALFSKMQDLDVQPNNRSYNLLVKVAGKANNIDKAEKYFQQAVQIFGDDVYLYGSLMFGYARKKDGRMVERLLQDLKLKGMTPTLPIYTTVINALMKEHQEVPSRGQNSSSLEKCWEYYGEIIKGGEQPDEHLRSLMIEVCACTHRAEQAVSLFESLQNEGFLKTNLPYDHYMKAMASRSDYASQALDAFHQMLALQIEPSSQSICHALKACAQLKDVKQANDVLAIMKNSAIPPTIYIYTQMAAVYASTNLIPELPPHIKQVYEKDLWNIVQRCQSQGIVNTQLLDNVIQYYCNDNRLDKIEGLVLPLFPSHDLQVTQFTVEKVLKMLVNTNQPQEALQLFQRSKDQEVPISYNSLNLVLQASIKLLRLEDILVTLKEFQSRKREPLPRLLKILSEMDNMPDSLFVTLNAFETKMGKVSSQVLRNKKADKYSHM